MLRRSDDCALTAQAFLGPFIRPWGRVRKGFEIWDGKMRAVFGMVGGCDTLCRNCFLSPAQQPTNIPGARCSVEVELAI